MSTAVNTPIARALVVVAMARCAIGLAPGAQAEAGLAGATSQTGALEPVEARLPFDEWLKGMRAEAIERGVRPETVDLAFASLAPLDIVVERDRTQAEFTLSLDKYLERRLAPRAVRRALEMRAAHRALVDRAAAAYGVESHVIIAVWGLESNFGRFSGVRPTIASLATLAWDGRRGSLFRDELVAALKILDSGDIPLDQMKGSWAGAMGQVQFMPSSYLHHAVDFDGDGRRDIWRSLPDVFASIANYLAQKGWTRGQRWGREVVVSAAAAARVVEKAAARTGGCRGAREMAGPLPLSEWQGLGITLLGGKALPKADVEASLVTAGSRHFLTYANYDALLAYNCAHSYALSVGLLADRIAAGSSKPRR